MALVNPVAVAEVTTVLSKHCSVFICICLVQGQVTSSRTEANYNPHFKGKVHAQGLDKITTLGPRASKKIKGQEQNTILSPKASTKLKDMSESQLLV